MAGSLNFDLPRVLAFVRLHVPGLAQSEHMRAIGWERSSEIVAGAVFDSYNGRNVFVHLAGAPGRQWLTRQFVRACMRYVFVVLACERLSATINESNTESRRFTEHFGFREEARLKAAAKDGGDILIYCLTKEACRHAYD